MIADGSPDLPVLLGLLTALEGDGPAGPEPVGGESRLVGHAGTEPVGNDEPARERPLRAAPPRGAARERRRRQLVGVAAVAVAIWGIAVAVAGGGVDDDAVRTAGATSTTARAVTTPTRGTPSGAAVADAPGTADPSGAPAGAGTGSTDTTEGAPTTAAAPATSDSAAASTLAAPPTTTATTTAPRTASTLPGAEAASSQQQQQRASTSRVPVAGRIIVPRLGLDTTMYEGGDLAQIDHGPSHLPYTVMPGRQGNTVVAGHRTTKTRPFYDLDKLVVGDTVTFVVASGTYTYVFSHHSVVTEDGVHILRQGTGYEATLFACHPKGKSSHRLVAHFTLQSAPDPATTTTTTTTTRPTTNTTFRLPGR